jgi:hypothetical protein
MTTTAPYAVTAAAGLPETELPDELIGRLPASAALAPWQTRCNVVSWLHEPDAAAIETFPPAIRPTSVALVAWALVRYEDTPVGPYSEIAATLIPAGGDGYGHIPFIVVDSLPSIVGGRANWLLPKALAHFEWSGDGRSVTVTSEQPATPAWSITVSYVPAGDTADIAVPNHVQQVSTDGVVRRFDGELTGTMQGGTVQVDGFADGPLAALLALGSHDATIMTDCQFNVGPLTLPSNAPLPLEPWG